MDTLLTEINGMYSCGTFILAAACENRDMRVAVFVLVPFLLAAQYRTPRRAPGANTGSTGAYNLPAVTFHGTVKQISGKEIVIVSDEQQEITIHRTRKTKFLKSDKEIKPSDIPEGAAVTLDVTKAPDLSLLAVNVFVDAPKPAQK
jgi:hypothetical protein